MTVDDNGRLSFFDGREYAIMVGIKKAHNLMQGFSAMVVSEHFYMAGGVAISQIRSELHFRMFRVFDTDKASNETDDDDVPVGGGRTSGSGKLLNRHFLRRSP
jgi:hypothetical protein